MRAFNANPPAGIDRCGATVVLRDKSGAQCMRRAVRGGFCAQHATKGEREAQGPMSMREIAAARRLFFSSAPTNTPLLGQYWITAGELMEASR